MRIDDSRDQISVCSFWVVDRFAFFFDDQKKNDGHFPPAAILYYLMPGMETTGCRLASSQVKAIPSVVVVGWLGLSPLSATSPSSWCCCWWMGLLLAEPDDEKGRRRLLAVIMSLDDDDDDDNCNVQSQSMLTADELVNSTIRIPVEPPVTLSTLSHPALLRELLAVNTTSNAVIVVHKI